jgi:hypothetical protein
MLPPPQPARPGDGTEERISARLPAPLLLGLRLAARRLWQMMLSDLGIAVTEPDRRRPGRARLHRGPDPTALSPVLSVACQAVLLACRGPD